MLSRKRRLALLVPSIFMIAACGAPPGEDSSSTESAITISPIRGNPPIIIAPAFVAPTYYTATAGQVIPMQSATESICLLQGVSGDFSGPSSVGWMYVANGNYYLAANGGAEVSAACAPLTDFTGTGTNALTSTAASPWWVSTSLPQDDIGQSTNAQKLWSAPQSACFLSGFAGDWSGIDTGEEQTNGIDQATVNQGWIATVDTNGSGLKVWANCYQFPERSSITRVGGGDAYGTGPQTVSLNATQKVGLCGLNDYAGQIVTFGGGGGNSANVTHDAAGNQYLTVTGTVEMAEAYCLAFNQGS